MKTQWNTGRHYDKHGQRMVAQTAEGTYKGATVAGVMFYDLSRNIEGFIEADDFVARSERDLQAFVMREYDDCNYHHPSRYGFFNMHLAWDAGSDEETTPVP